MESSRPRQQKTQVTDKLFVNRLDKLNRVCQLNRTVKINNSCYCHYYDRTKSYM